MTLISSIITDAYRENNTLALGASPSTLQSTEGLRLLQAVVSAEIGGDAGEQLRDWPLGNYGRQASDKLDRSAIEIANPPINSRLVHTAEAAITVYFPPAPSDGSRFAISDPFSRLAAYPVTLDGNGRLVETAATLTLNTNALNVEWFYRADLGTWVRVTDLATDADLPFPEDYDMMFIILLAIRLSPRYGASITDATAMMFKQQRRQFLARYVQSADLVINDDLARPSLQGYDSARGWDTSTDQFNRGL